MVDCVIAPRALGAVSHEASVLEDAQMQRDGGAADGKTARDVHNRLLPTPEALEDGAPGRIPECVEHGFEGVDHTSVLTNRQSQLTFRAAS